MGPRADLIPGHRHLRSEVGDVGVDPTVWFPRRLAARSNIRLGTLVKAARETTKSREKFVMNLLIINAILATAMFVVVVGPLLWAIRSGRDELHVMATPHEPATRALRLSPVLRTGG
jgi:hypothetical protein